MVLIYINALLLRIVSNFVWDRSRGIYMAKHPDDPMPSFKLGKEQTDAMLGMQKDLFEGYEKGSRAWLARVKSEVELWSELANKLAATRSAPEAMQAYQQCVAQRMQMAAEDGRRMS